MSSTQGNNNGAENNQKPVGYLPDPKEFKNITLDLSSGQSRVALDELGPVVVNEVSFLSVIIKYNTISCLYFTVGRDDEPDF